MVRHWRLLPVPGFSDCSWAEYDVDKDRPVAIRNVLKLVNFLLEGYFRALYVPLGGSKTRIENITSKSMKFYISVFSDKPPCMPLHFGIVESATIILLEAARAFSSFLASTTGAFFSSTSSSFLVFFFFLLPLCLLS